ncbi:MAG: choice-of-anchor tandem repeat GloVer-containing protein, partial [Candidatus Sulfotelmatobacter sp.]
MKSATSQRTIFSRNQIQLFVVALAAMLFGSVIASAQTGTVLYSFNGTTDGKTPYGGVVLDSEGNLYGTTFEGRDTCYSLPDSCGVVFKLTPSGTQTLVHPFVGSGKPGLHDGDWPWAGLVMDKRGNFYGTTSAGGSSNAGTVFKLGPTGKETVLYSFKGYADGNEPEDNLILDGEG